MARSSLVVAALVAVPLLAGCPSRGPAASTDAGLPAVAAPDASVAAVPSTLELTVQYQDADGGVHPVTFATGSRATIDPTRALDVETNLPLRNYRLRLFDEADRAMSSDDEAENKGDGIEYRIRLPEPLKSGHSYALVLDAQTGASVLDAQGRSHPDQRLELRVSGEREKPAPERPAHRGKTVKHVKRHRR